MGRLELRRDEEGRTIERDVVRHEAARRKVVALDLGRGAARDPARREPDVVPQAPDAARLEGGVVLGIEGGLVVLEDRPPVPVRRIEDDQVVEELSESELSRSGTLSDGASYSVISQGGLSGAGGGAGRYLTCSVKIDGVEYAVQRIGLNFVVYDTENSCVVDSCEFNTYIGLDPKRVDVADLVKAAETAREQMNIGDTN